MSGIKSITDRNGLDVYPAAGNETVISVEFMDGEIEHRTFELCENLEVSIEGISVKKKAIRNLSFPARSEIDKCGHIQFEECVFIGNFELNCSVFNSKIVFKNCIFTDGFSLFGTFYDLVSFESSSFLNSKVNFSECRFNHFILIISSFSNCTITFQETEFYSNNVFLGELSLFDSQMLFINSFFSKNSDLLELTSLFADRGSKIVFRMVDFNFGEVRLYGSDISNLEFIDCTFECNRFDFDCDSENLIIQDCKNFRVITLSHIRGLKNLNILNLFNTGKIILNQDSAYYINAIRSKESMIWVRGYEYKAPESTDIKRQLYTLMSIYDLSQTDSAKAVQLEIDNINKAEQIMKFPYENMKIFLSYSWKDTELADNIEAKFASIGVKLVRDKHDLNYKVPIKEFMRQIRRTDYVLLIISENYLKSPNCMYEIVELTKDPNYKDRILPVIHNRTNIFSASGKSDYTLHWQKEFYKLKAKAQELDDLNRNEINLEILMYERIMRDLQFFLSDISEMYSIICDTKITNDDFEEIWKFVIGNSGRRTSGIDR